VSFRHISLSQVFSAGIFHIFVVHHMVCLQTFLWPVDSYDLKNCTEWIFLLTHLQPHYWKMGMTKLSTLLSFFVWSTVIKMHRYSEWHWNCLLCMLYINCLCCIMFMLHFPNGCHLVLQWNICSNYTIDLVVSRSSLTYVFQFFWFLERTREKSLHY